MQFIIFSFISDTLLALLLYLLYRPTLHGPFLFDDLTILNSTHMLQQVHGPSVHQPLSPLPSFLYSLRQRGLKVGLRSLSDYIQFRPLTYWTYELDVQHSGLNPRGYRRTSLVVGALVVISARHVVSALLLSWGVDSTEVLLLSFMSALLFLSHPLLTMSIAYIAGRSSLLCMLFMLLASWSVLSGYWLLVVPFMALSLLSKEEGLMSLPLIIGLIFIRGGYQ